MLLLSKILLIVLSERISTCSVEQTNPRKTMVQNNNENKSLLKGKSLSVAILENNNNFRVKGYKISES